MYAVKLKEDQMFIGNNIECGANLGGGRKCKETATVIDTEVNYRKEFADGGFEQVVDEVYYTMECPKCGTWSRAETMHSSCTFATS